MLPKVARLWAAFCLVLLLQHATAQSFQAVRRQDDGRSTITTTATSEGEPRETSVDGKDEKKNVSKDESGSELKSQSTQGNDEKDDSKDKHTATESKGHVESSTTATTTPTSTNLTGNQMLDDSNFVNATIPEGQLPIEPRVTPGYGVAGAVLMITGVAYTLIGTKNRWLHTFFSSAYLAGLGITVLIIYLMKVPVSDGLQGGYVAAVIFPAILVGGASVFFKELTEGLGCALGGFSVSMWLLCLVPGGLVDSTASKAIFIACFTLAGFAFYFSRYTRDWALILMMSFAGATVTVLGIDCFSRAGLKEFWAYVWDLNDDLFPLGATTYPVTKGIRVETAAVVIICLFGIISQIKLWKIVRQKRADREAAREAQRQDLERQEMDVGQAVEEANARERQQWERAHGEGDTMTSTVSRLSNDNTEKGDSNEKSETKDSVIEVIEMSELSGSEEGRAPAALMEEQDKAGKITVRVAEDDTRPAFAESEDVLDEHSSDRLPSGQLTSSRSATEHRLSNVPAPAPDVIPLPFSIPQLDDSASHGDRSSIATYADEENGVGSPTQRRSMAKRLSASSGKLLRSFSQRSAASTYARGRVNSGSDEDLVIPRSGNGGGDDGSIAATVDDSVDSDDRRLSDITNDERKTIEITAELSDKSPQPTELESAQVAQSPRLNTDDSKQTHVDETVPRKSGDTLTVPRSPALGSSFDHIDNARQSLEIDGPPARSVASAVSTTPVNLTKDRLPKSLSRVALSYRTNEWAKHLSNAETPSPEKLDLSRKSNSTRSHKEQAETSAPLDVGELQKTAEDGVPAAKTIRQSMSKEPTAPVSRSASQRSNGRIDGAQEIANDALAVPKRRSGQTSPGLRLSRSSSANGLKRLSNFDTIVEEKPAARSPTITEEADARVTKEAAAGGPTNAVGSLPPSSSTPGIVSYDSPQTLLGQREMFLRSRSQGNLPANPSDAGLAISYPSHTAPGSDAGSLYNYPAYAAALGADADDMPLSQRKEYMRQSTMMSLNGNETTSNALSPFPGEPSQRTSPKVTQPWRVSNVPSQADREARLASFRSSVAQDLRSGTPMGTPSARATPFASTQNLLGGTREHEVERNMEMQRNAMLGQREAEGQQREMEKMRKMRTEQVFDERMRSGDLLEAHREAMRKMQKAAKD